MPDPQGRAAEIALLPIFDVANLSLEMLMFQARYLAIASTIDEGHLRFDKLEFLSREAYQHFHKSLPVDCRLERGDGSRYHPDLLTHLKNGTSRPWVA